MKKTDTFKNVYGRNVFITGASSGIGEACARMFAENGCSVTGVSRNIEEKTESYPGGGSISTHRLDVTDEQAVREFINKLSAVDIAVLCAGMGVAGPAETTSQDMTRKQMEVNYFGTINAAQPCLSKMRAQGKGLLIVIGSIAGRVSIPMQSQYSASKYALEAFTDAVRMEMKPYGVRAVIIEPGDTKTGFTAARETQIDADDSIDEKGLGQGVKGREAQIEAYDRGEAKSIGKRVKARGESGSVYGDLITRSVAKMEADEQNGRSPDSVAKVALALAGRRNPPARVPVGLEYKALMMLLRVMPDRGREFILSRMYLPVKK